MPTNTLTSIDNLEQEVAELQAQLRDSIPVLAQLKDIPGQLATLAAESTALNAAAAAVTSDAAAQAAQLAAGRAALEERFAQWLQEAAGREAQWQATADARAAQLAEQWESFRSAAETEQNQVMRIAMTTRQELTDRAAVQEKLVASLDERLEKMNGALANMVSDLQVARRDQKRLGALLTVVALAALALSAAAAWAAFLA
jgi:chromosome segregation ATPase